MRNGWAVLALLAGCATPAPQGTGLEKTDLFEAGKDGYALYRIPGIVVTKKGTVLAYCEARKSNRGDWGPIDVLLRRSVDGGKTWGPPRPLVHLDGDLPLNPVAAAQKLDKPGDNTVNNPVAVVDHETGDVHFLYCLEYMRCYYMRSGDDGETWTAPVEITSAFEPFRPEYDWKVIATGPAHGIQLTHGPRRGRLVVPVWISTGTGGHAHRPSVASTIFSDDHGRTWRRGAVALPDTPETRIPNETVVVQLADGRVMLNARSESHAHRRLVTVSPDGASDWSAPRFDDALLEPICMAGIVRHPAGPILFSNPHNLDRSDGKAAPGKPRDRKNVSVKLSRDDGKSWSAGRTLEAGWSGYSDLAVAADGTVLCFYERGSTDGDMYRTGSLCLARFSLDWLGGETVKQEEGLLDRSLDPPVVNTRPGPEYDDRVRTGNMVIGIERTPKGRLWACWVGNGDNPNGFFLLATSDDGGRTWSKPRVVIDPADLANGLQRRALVGNLWTDPLGRLWLFFDQSLGYFDGRAGDWYTRCDDPDAQEPVWSKPVRIADGCTLNKPTVLSNGDWLLPVALWTRDRIRPDVFKDAHKDLDPIRMANVFASTDQGRTWKRRGGVAFPETDFDEHMIVELKDGRLWMPARTKKSMSESFSSDKGVTWSAPQPSTILNPSARFFIRRLASGRLLLVKNGPIDLRLPRRSSMTAFLSDDDGKSWSRGLLLDDRALVSYPDGFQAPDGSIHIVYDWNRHTDAEILLAQFREEDVVAGRFATPGARSRILVNKAHAPHLPAAIVPDAKWAAQAEADAKQDRSSVAYDGISPNKLVCDTTLRELPDGSWALFLLAGDDFEPSPKNYTGLTRSADHGKSWTAIQPVDLGLPREGRTSGQGPTELLVQGDRCTLFFSTHSQTWGRDWRSWMIHSADGCRTWSKPEPLPGRLARFTFIRNHIVTRDGRILLPFQRYEGPPPGAPEPPPEEKPWHKALAHYVSNPRNGVLMSGDGGRTWTEHGDVRLTPDDRYHGWAENNLVELGGGRIAMIIRADRLGGVLYSAESRDGGRTWPDYARATPVPNPGSKATIYGLGGDVVAMLHNPNSKHRSPLALWVSFDGMKTWPYQRILVKESSDGPKGRLNYPDGFVSADRQWLHFAFDDNRHRAVHYSAKLPSPEKK